MRVVIMSGIPGSGKSTYVKENLPEAVVVSADDYFTTRTGAYKFDSAKLPQAHNQCLRRFTNFLITYSGGQDLIVQPILVVDNTNLTVAEIAPYAALAQAYGADLEIITLVCTIETAAKRNVHGVPEEAVDRMARTLAGRALPPWWPHQFVGPL